MPPSTRAPDALLRELATLVTGMERRPSVGYSSYAYGKEGALRKTIYEEAFECVYALCELLYPGVESTALSWEGWEHVPTTRMGCPSTYSLVPVGSAEQMRVTTSILSKTALYSDLSVAPVDVELETGYISYSGGDRKSWEAFWPIVSQLVEHRTLLATGKFAILPRAVRTVYGSVSEETIKEYGAPLVQGPGSAPYLPLNRSRLSPLRDLLVYEEVVLPYFPGARLEDIAKIAEEETEAFLLFTTFLRNRLVEISRADSSQDIRQLVDELRAGAASIALEAKKIQKGNLLRGAQMATFTVSLIATVIPDVTSAVSDIAGITGAVSLLELLRETVGHQKEQLTLRNSEFYVPYLLSKSS